MDDNEIVNFLFTGNVINLLMAIVIGKAFGELIQSTVADIILPLLNYSLNGGLNVSGFYIKLGNHSINYGKSLGLLITLFISVLTLYYLFIRPFNNIIEKNDKKKDEKQIQTIKKVLHEKEQMTILKH
jgi:large conductance mechanosensitive channel